MRFSCFLSTLARWPIADSALLLLLFLVPAGLLFRFCRTSILPRWRYGLPLLPLSQGLLLAVTLYTVLQFQPGGAASLSAVSAPGPAPPSGGSSAGPSAPPAGAQPPPAPSAGRIGAPAGASDHILSKSFGDGGHHAPFPSRYEQPFADH